MKNLQELEKVERELRETSERRAALRAHLLHLSQEIFSLNRTRLITEENIAILKNTRTIALASEYKRAKEDIDRIDSRLNFLKIDQNNHEKMLIRLEKTYEDLRDKVVQLMSDPVGKVIRGRFGKGNGQK
jgi:chromosome segregation ATPase